MPPVRSDADCLKSAMRDYCNLAKEENSKDYMPDRLVQSLKKPKKNGFQVLDIERREDDNEYCKNFGCKVDADGTVVVTRGYADDYAIQQFYQRHKRLVTGGAVSSTLASIAKDHLGGAMLKSGLYWIPEDNRHNWSEASKAFRLRLSTAIRRDRAAVSHGRSRGQRHQGCDHRRGGRRQCEAPG